MTLDFKTALIWAAALSFTTGCSSGMKQQADPVANMSTEPKVDTGQNTADPVLPEDELGAIQTFTEDSMGSTKGHDFTDIWARRMIVHQKGAIGFSDLLLRRSSQPMLRKIAVSIVSQARGNIQALASITDRGILGRGTVDTALARRELEIFQSMALADGKTFDALWVAKMLVYEEGAANFASVAVNRGSSERARGLARQLVTQQYKNAELLNQFVAK